MRLAILWFLVIVLGMLIFTPHNPSLEPVYKLRSFVAEEIAAHR